MATDIHNRNHRELISRTISDAESLMKVSGAEGVDSWWEHQASTAPGLEPLWSEAAYRVLRSEDPTRATRYCDKLTARGVRPKLARSIFELYANLGQLSRAYEVGESMSAHEPRLKLRLAQVKAQLDLLTHGVDCGSSNPHPVYVPVTERILYVLHSSIPYTTAGYTVRSQGLLRALRGLGRDVIGVTRLGYPWAEREFIAKEVPIYGSVDGVPYVRLPSITNSYREQTVDRYIDMFAERLIALANICKPSILHAASNYVCGLATAKAARILGIPCVYEVRGLWEVTMVSRMPFRRDSEYFHMMAKMETEAAHAATAVLAITGAIRDELVSRGVPAEKIGLLPNGVDTTKFVPLPADSELRDQLGLRNKVVIGFVGSLTSYEGLDDLLMALSQLNEDERDQLALLIVGDGPCKEELERLSQELNLESLVIFTEKVPHDDVLRYYSIIDVAPFPRKGLAVCEMVSPLKPFEAMAMGKAVICSDVAALAEIVQDNQTGLLHRKDDIVSLAGSIRRFLDEPDLRSRLGTAAREWVWDPLESTCRHASLSIL